MKNILLLGRFATYEELMVYLSNICSVWCFIGLLELGLWKPSLSGGIFKLLLKNESIAHSLKIMDCVQRDWIWGTLRLRGVHRSRVQDPMIPAVVTSGIYTPIQVKLKNRVRCSWPAVGWLGPLPLSRSIGVIWC